MKKKKWRNVKRKNMKKCEGKKARRKNDVVSDRCSAVWCGGVLLACFVKKKQKQKKCFDLFLFVESHWQLSAVHQMSHKVNWELKKIEQLNQKTENSWPVRMRVKNISFLYFLCAQIYNCTYVWIRWSRDSFRAALVACSAIRLNLTLHDCHGPFLIRSSCFLRCCLVCLVCSFCVVCFQAVVSDFWWTICRFAWK